MEVQFTPEQEVRLGRIAGMVGIALHPEALDLEHG
jgi:hypothetical protein